MRVSEIETPALLIDLDVMERNLQRVAKYAREHALRLRPHTKTHKIPALGRKQVELGAAGLTVAKVGEAEVMIESGTPDLLVAYPVIGSKKLDRLMEVARRARVTVSLDSLTAARQLSEAAREAQVDILVLAEMDAGLGRVGVNPGQELIDLATGISRLPRLRLEGIAFYPGHIKSMQDHGEQDLENLSRLIERVVEELRAAGLPANIVSGGSTPTLFHSHKVRGVNEIRPGTYIFNDRNTVEAGACAWEDCAASILVTVVSTARPGQIIIDGGSKTFSSDRLATTGEPTHGLVREAPNAVFTKMNEEHGYVDIRKVENTRFQVGDRLRVVPNHVCVCMNLHEQVYGIRGDTVEQTWPVAARGKLQ
jgi:D-serine deaminase-like pyridoxal phosphate-dependent protein